jgi:hypothetical protein
MYKAKPLSISFRIGIEKNAPISLPPSLLLPCKRKKRENNTEIGRGTMFLNFSLLVQKFL